MYRTPRAVPLAVALGAIAALLGACASPPKPVGMVQGRLLLVESPGQYVYAPPPGPPGSKGYPAFGVGVGSPPIYGSDTVPAGSTVTITPAGGGPGRRLAVRSDGTFQVQVSAGRYQLVGSSKGFDPPLGTCNGPGTITVGSFKVVQVSVVCLRRGP